MSSYNEKFDKFVANYGELIDEYETIESSTPLEYCKDDIVDLYENYAKINKCANFQATLSDALKLSIRYEQSITDSLESIINSYMIDNSDLNSTQQYFKEINDIYTRNKNNFNIEYCPENREKLIEMNLKTVISVAKKYQGLGLTLNELISAGNLGLVTAFDKFDPERSKTKDEMLDIVEELCDVVEFNEIQSRFNDFLRYGDVKKKFTEYFQPKHSYKKQEIIKWVNKNIYNAKFNSVAVMWIKAYILIEIDNNSRIVKKPKTEIYKDREKFGSYKKEITVDIDAPVSEDSDTALSDILSVEDTSKSELEISEAYDTFKSGLNLLLDGVKTRDRSIFLKKFGIGLPRPMLPKEIAEQEGLSIARISQIFQTVIEQMQLNSIKYDINQDILFDAVRKIM